jgi:hypothetical protein
MRNRWRRAAVLVGLVLAACSGSGGVGGATLATTPRVAASATVPADPFPPADTPFDVLSPTMKRVWGDYGLTVVPGRDVEQTAPQAPPVVNMTDGHETDADAAVMAQSLVWRNHLVQWALRTKQWEFLSWVQEHFALSDAPFDAYRKADIAVDVPSCFVVPARLSLWRADDARDPVVLYDHVLRYFAMHFEMPCVFTTADSEHREIGGFRQSTVWLVAGYVLDDPVLGGVWRGYITPCDGLTGHDAPCAL